MYVNEKPKRKLLSLMAFLMVLSLGVWSCAGNSGEEAADEQTEMTDESASDHPEGSEHPSEHPAAADTTAQDSTGTSEHPDGGSEHPNN